VSGGTADLRGWLETQRQRVEQALERFVPAAASIPAGPFIPATARAPAIVAEATRYSLFAGGKRLRPMLALAAAEAVAAHLGESPDAARDLALPSACALELIHTYSLVHDDLPAMDDDTLRRGRPTAHVVYGEGMAILAGDALLTEAFALLAREPSQAPQVAVEELNRRKLQTLAIIADAAGAAGMVGGQAIDLQAASGASPMDGGALREMHMRKTGAMIVASGLGGAIMAGASEGLAEAIGRYGVEIGLAFQIVDDILDVEGASADLGKTAGKDAAAGKPTYPSLYGLDESKRLASECMARALDGLERARLGGQLPAIARWVVGRTN
jgi:geranylgeranyl diphosphate synthase type II